MVRYLALVFLSIAFNTNILGYQSRQQPYYAHYPQYPVDGIYYQPAVSYIPYIPPFAVSTVPVSTPQHQPPSNQSNQPHGNSSNSEIQGEYHFGTWYPSVGKENDNAETDDHSEGNLNCFRNFEIIYFKFLNTASIIFLRSTYLCTILL